MKAKIVIIFFLLLTSIPSISQAYEREYLTVLLPGHTPGSYEINLKEVSYGDNTAYIPVNQQMSTDKATTIAMVIMRQFAKEHAETKVVDWKPIYMPIPHRNHLTITFVGIFVNQSK